MGERNSGRRPEPIRKSMLCSCGSSAKLFQRRNYPFGRKSGARVMRGYKCLTCNKIHALTKPKEIRR